jgi:hypothetical protein
MITVNSSINAHKILVTPIVLALMWHFHNWSAEAFVYLALHGTYSLLWLLKQTSLRFRQMMKPI